MQQSEPRTNTPASAPEKPMSIEEIMVKIPFLLNSDKSPNSEALFRLISEVASTPYKPDNKYELMYKVIRISNLDEKLYQK